MKRPIILVIDDEVNHFDVIEALFKHQDYQLYYASNGEDAIVSLSAFKPDLILLDVLMPGISGIEVCRRIKALPQWQSVPIIIVTILDTKTNLRSCVKAGADDFITKPFDSIELRARVHTMLKIKKQHDKNQTLSRIQANTLNLLESTLGELRGSLTSQLSHDDLRSRIEQSTYRLERLTAKFQIYMELELAASQSVPLQTDTRHNLSVAAEIVKVLAQKYNRSHDLSLLIEDAEVSMPARYLSIIFNELVDNALKFSSPETSIIVRSTVTENFVTLFIHDSGPGMTEETIAGIDDAIQFERSIYEQNNGGMGLKIVKKIVVLAGGTFLIESAHQQGTTVQVTLPKL
ncbi:response regulator [Leptolyngbya cf. ectocarpi LEGE 11479]|uniref:histidine kinase n=1 Tax=Leptolyngbya cf. ectocarpi LEGE 11479 TaxID=1828722 RepID=A0A928ZXS2_LEPEC|nr:response regulator [Leptolyngbya ectocarpi]MBE9069454.1 response regulator [Leptolyngbya cf. ectocarpi LEGE 11479]